jgi:glycosyltransferase 2 family protein
MLFRSTGRCARTLLVTLKFLLAILLMMWLVRSGRLNLRSLAAVELDSTFGWIILCQMLMLVIPFVRWYVLICAIGLSLSRREAVQAALVGCFANIFVPSGLGQDGIRLYYLTKANAQRTADSVSTIVIDRVLGVAGLMMLGVLFGGLFLSRNFSQSFAEVVVVVAGILTFLLIVLLLLFDSRVSERIERIVRLTSLRNLARSLHQYKSQKLALLIAFVLSLIGHLANVLSTYLTFSILGSGASLLDCLAITPIVNLSGMLPLTPLGIGVTDGVAEALYAIVHVSEGAEMTMILRAVTISLCALGGIALLVPVAGAESPVPAQLRTGDDVMT